ncbi:TetR/AcrR family transcriptional regulator [Halogeometricum luteum]|uniref:TetR/AcrR family transcriptional regulator n=1 Tax=Halogeometricum luteum TaxID=2950537 RepID=A0ABU2G8K5_9EURY|nr:TetR/AcrR family transcriptional regulator [Halogeometricum sp. S3BR5-2]MDS0296578.1 TetR/AcrR family transcriptional regulator [Halogeometricum sp. S3BR5-2]
MTEAVPTEAQAEITDAVRKALAKHGYARLTTAKIAAESSKTEAGLYYHYDSKDAMVVAFLESATGFLRRQLEEIEATDPEARLREACDRLFVKFDDEPRRRTNIAVMELLAHAPHNETLQGPLLELESSNLTVVKGIVEDGIEQGVFREIDARGVAAFLLAAASGSTGFYLALEMEDIGAPLHAQAESYIDSLLV